MSLARSAEVQVRKHLLRMKIFTLVQLITLLCCSRRTAQRSLKAWGCHTSYNANAAYYALPETVRFDSQGIWRCGPAAFSRHGTLSETLCTLVVNSPDGMTAGELKTVLNVAVHSLLPAIVRSGSLTRSKIHGAYVYFAADSGIRRRQETARRGHGQRSTQLSDADAVTVLVAFVRKPWLEPAQLAQEVRSRAPTASVGSIERFFAVHQLQPAKKRASDSTSSNSSGSTANG